MHVFFQINPWVHCNGQSALVPESCDMKHPVTKDCPCVWSVVWWFSLFKLHCGAVDAETFSGRSWSIVEHVTKMGGALEGTRQRLMEPRHKQVWHQNAQQQSNQDKQYHILFTGGTLVEICLQNWVNHYTRGGETVSVWKVADHILVRLHYQAKTNLTIPIRQTRFSVIALSVTRPWDQIFKFSHLLAE